MSSSNGVKTHPQFVVLVVEADKFEKMLRKAKRRNRVGSVMIVAGTYLIILSALRPRRRNDDSWANAAK